MMSAKRIFYTLLILLFTIPAFGATHTVTQSGGGTSCTSDGGTCSVVEFNALGGTGYAGDTFNFSGSITSQIDVDISGTSGNNVVLDGTSATIDVNVGSTAEGSIKMTDERYLTLQNFTIDGQQTTGESTDAGIGIVGTTSTDEHIIIDNDREPTP